jgi:hypothetical protein
VISTLSFWHYLAVFQTWCFYRFLETKFVLFFLETPRRMTDTESKSLLLCRILRFSILPMLINQRNKQKYTNVLPWISCNLCPKRNLFFVKWHNWHFVPTPIFSRSSELFSFCLRSSRKHFCGFRDSGFLAF